MLNCQRVCRISSECLVGFCQSKHLLSLQYIVICGLKHLEKGCLWIQKLMVYPIWRFPEIGVPPVIIHFSGIFPHKNHLFLGTPMTSWKSPIGKDVSIACTLLVFSMVTTCDNNSTSKARLPFFSWLSWSFARLNMVYDGYIYTYQHISK